MVCAICVSLDVLGGCRPPTPESAINACGSHSIQAAVDHAPSGGLVLICDGIHDEAVIVRKPLTLLGASRQGVVLTGGKNSAIITIEGVDTSVVIKNLTLRSSPRSSITRTGVHVVASRDVMLSDLSVDFHNVVAPTSANAEHTAPDGGAWPVRNGFIGVDVETSTVRLQDSTIESMGPHDYVNAGVRIRGLSTVHIEQIEVDHVSGPAVQSSDSDVFIDRSKIRRSLTNGIEVLSGFVQVSDSTIDAVENDGLVVSGGYLRSNGVSVTAPLRYGVLAAGGLLELNRTRIKDAGEGVHATLGGVVASESIIENSRDVALYAHDSGFIVYDKGSVIGGGVGVLLDFNDAYVTVSNTDIRGTNGHGLDLRNGQLVMVGGNIVMTGQAGVWAENGSLLLDGVTIEHSRADGVVLTGVAEASVANTIVRNNVGWGVVCNGGTVGLQSRVKLEVCTGRFTGNIQGETHLFNGCQILSRCFNLDP